MDEVLMAAAQELDRRGWCKGRSRNEAGEVCLFGAVMSAVHPNTYGVGQGFSDEDVQKVMPHLERLTQYINSKTGLAYPGSVYKYNDFFLTTKEEAAKTLMEAAEYHG